MVPSSVMSEGRERVQVPLLPGHQSDPSDLPSGSVPNGQHIRPAARPLLRPAAAPEGAPSSFSQNGKAITLRSALSDGLRLRPRGASTVTERVLLAQGRLKPVESPPQCAVPADGGTADLPSRRRGSAVALADDGPSPPAHSLGEPLPAPLTWAAPGWSVQAAGQVSAEGRLPGGQPASASWGLSPALATK